MQPEDTERTYDTWGLTYDEDHSSRTSSEISAVEEIVVSSLLRHIEFMDVLDAGTGTGRYALRLAAEGKRVVAIDQSARMLAEGQRKAKEQGLDIVFRKESISSLSAGDSSFDLVLCMLALAHVRNIDRAYQEFLRVLKPGGHLITSDIHPDTQKAWGPQCTIALQGTEHPFPAYHSSIQEYVEAVAAAGAILLAAIDVPMQQRRGLVPGPFVVFARKP